MSAPDIVSPREGASGGDYGSLQLPDLDATESDLIVMVLQQNPAARVLAEAGHILEFTERDLLAIVRRAAHVVQHFDAVQPMLDAVVRVHDDPRMLPFTDLRREANACHESAAREDV